MIIVTVEPRDGGLALRAGHGGPSPEPVGCWWTARATPAARAGRCVPAGGRTGNGSFGGLPRASNSQPCSDTMFLNKAAVRTGSSHPWRSCTVTQVEETKQMLRMIPILICTFIPSTMVAQSHTLFIKQGTTLDRTIGSNFKVPPASLYAFVTISMLLSIVIYDRIFVKIMQRVTRNPRGITMLQRMGIGMIFHVLVMTVASRVEKRRLYVARANGLVRNGSGQVLPLTIFTLLPQFMLTGVADALLQIANVEFFYDQAPKSMKSLGSSYMMTSLGIGNFLTTSGVNFFVFLGISQLYVYRAEVSDELNKKNEVG
ncbi:protein NRT1/ PTR FAMILY 5.2-like [Cucurbita maxima]|uniref:Protein NRT1/ PTR FAMILY 5.2-like n=1 Tax=Cucurbita maxima TaxID=3661 RepID=A0A6J1ITP5_CUCMA|nr:protein NRT1/ PTR FAMILY 5.2-like [Cucurbita maxima]